MSLPKQLLYNNLQNASYARNFQSNIAPQNGQSYNVGETIIFNVPTANNMVMSGADTILKFSVNLKTTADASYANFDRAGASGLIQRLRIFHGSTLLSDIDNYGNLMAMMTSLMQSSDSVAGKLNILQGTSNHTGSSIFENKNTGSTAKLDFGFPLLSILSLSNNYVPLYAMTGAPLRIELQLVSSILHSVATKSALTINGSYLITNAELICNMMEISDQGMEIVNQASGDVVQWVVSDYRNYGYNASILNGSETQLSVPVPAKYNSLKSLFFSFRANASGATGKFPYESCKFKLSEYTTRIGPKVIPTKAPNTTAEFFSELVRSIGSVSDINHECNISKAVYDDADTVSTYTNGSQLSKSFYVGIDLESYSNTDMSTVYKGYNTSTDDIFFQPKFASQASDTNIRVDTYAMFDSLILFENGFAVVQY
jgi:hypothetical protein